MKPTFIPAKPTNTVVSWKSSNEDIVTVSEKGLITAIKAGEATITVTTEDGSKTAECKVNCVQWPDAVKLDLTFVSMKPGNTQQLTITTTPDSIGAVPMKYVSDTPDVVTVDKNGVLTAKKYGEAIITVSPLSGADVKATCKVAVEIPVTSIQLDKDTICQKPNTFAQLTATY